MCEECRKHGTDCTKVMVQNARPEQIRRLILDILTAPSRPGGTTA
ncbi:MAG: hypothetical protein AAFQ39_14945 [Pseudomonadota bacterium]